jgi:AcrR family transcriptional regulator
MVGPAVSTTPPIQEPTPALRDALHPAGVKPTPGAAFVLAQAWVRAGRRLDMAALAAEVGVSRNTLYRWTGDRDRLLADVVWADLSAMVARAVAATTAPPGLARLQDVANRLLDLIVEESAVRTLLANEGATGLRMLTAPGGPIRPRLVALVAGYIEAQVRDGAYRAPAAPEVLADGVLSLGERFLHHGGDPALNPDPASAKAIISLVLREP